MFWTIVIGTLGIGLLAGDTIGVREEVVHEVSIAGVSPKQVYEVVSNVERYEEWAGVVHNSHVHGEGLPEHELRLHLASFPIFPVLGHVLTRLEDSRFSFLLTPLYVRGFLNLEHIFLVAPLPQGQGTRVTHTANFRGILVHYLFPFMAEYVDRTVQEFDNNLKARFEGHTQK